MTSESEPAVDTFAEANKAHFNKIAHEYDDMPHAVERARRTAAAIRKVYNFDENSTTVMEYACGTGLVSRELAAYSKRIVGVDISQGMVDQYNRRVYNQGIPSEEMHAVCVELKGEPGELEDEKFDVIVCAAAYHHFTSIDDVTRILTYFLKPGGTLLVVDLAPKGHLDMHSSHTHWTIPEEVHHFVPHRHGLEESVVRKAFEGAGLISFSYDLAIAALHDMNIFVATGTKPTV